MEQINPLIVMYSKYIKITSIDIFELIDTCKNQNYWEMIWVLILTMMPKKITIG